MKAGDLIKMVVYNRTQDSRNQVGLVISIEHRYVGGPHRIATVLSDSGKVATWPIDSHYQLEVINESR